jgi:hypothetical protein
MKFCLQILNCNAKIAYSDQEEAQLEEISNNKYINV